MAIKLESTTNVAEKGIKVCVYGPSGVGKTRLVIDAPNPLLLSAEPGLRSLQDEEIDYIKIKTVKDIDEAYRFIIKGEGKKYDTIILDSLSEMAEVLLAEIKPDEKDGRQAYAKMADALMPMIRRFRDIDNKDVVFICKMKRVEDEATGKILSIPFLPGQVLPNQLPYMFDEVFAMLKSKKGTVYFQTESTHNMDCKDRSGRLDPQEPANLTKVFAKIRGKSKTDDKPGVFQDEKQE